MPNYSQTTQQPDVAVLPRRDKPGSRYLDADSALDLALYGATACRMTSLARLIDTVWCLTGGGWRPPQEVIAAGLRKASAGGTILATESWVRSIPFFYSLTPKGAQAFRTLMMRPLPNWDDPISRSAAAIKFGLLDVTETEDVPAVIADLKRFYCDIRTGLLERREGLSRDRPFLQAAMADRLAWVDQRLNTLDVCTHSESHRRVVH